MNHFQQAEINHHNDAELLWFISSTIELFKQNPNNFKDKQFNRFSLYKKVGIVIAVAIAQREGFDDKNHQLSSSEAAQCLWSSYVEKYPQANQECNTYEEVVCPFVDNLIYKALLRTRVPLQEPVNEYWPFGAEGGFCNPNKLSMLE